MADQTPDHLHYTADHEWIRTEGDTIVIGITHFAQGELGDVVYVDLPSADTRVEARQPFGEVESTKSVSDLFAPVSGVIVGRNDELEDRPELINQDAYGQGWLVTIKPDDLGDVAQLLDADAYRALLD